MQERPIVTSREAVLASMLAHALLFIFILLNPGIFKGGRLVFAPAPDANAPIPVAFLRPEPKRDDSAVMADAGRRNVSEPRPPDAPPPENDDPYSRGNTPNRFVAPQVPLPPRPDVGAAGSGEDPEFPAAGQPAGTQPGTGSAAEKPVPSGQGLPAPPAGSRGQSRPGSLRDTLGRMSVGMSGGAPLKYDNPSGGLAGPMGGLSFDTPGFDWGPYARKIYWVIWTNWTQGWPPAAWAGLEGVVTVRFRIWKDGRITDITVVDESGTPAFDTCATLALEASSPLPPLPADFPGESEGITARFLYNVSRADP